MAKEDYRYAQVSNNGNVTMSFSLNPDQLNQQFDAIDKETGLTTSTTAGDCAGRGHRR